MQLSIGTSDLAVYVSTLTNNLTPTGEPLRVDARLVGTAIERLEHCFSKIHLKFFREDRTPIFNHLHGDHFAMFLWFLANTAWKTHEAETTPTRLSIMNRALHGLDLFYNVEMPSVFLLVHPLGTVLGRAEYADYFVAYQNCTVGAEGPAYPTFQGPVILYSGSSVIGDCRIGENVVFGARASIIGESVPPNSLVTQQTPNARVQANSRCVRCREFRPQD